MTPRLGPQAWEAIENRDRPAPWTSDPDAGVVRGPYDLGLLERDRLALTLDDGQVALLTVRGEPAAVYFSGAHLLDLGAPSAAPPQDGLLYLLHLGRDLRVPWRQNLPVPRDVEDDARASGAVTVRIADPLTFHEHFLRGRSGEGEAICRDALAHLLASFLAIHVDRPCDDGALEASSLDEPLAPYGLACVAVEARRDEPADVTA